MVDSEFAAIVDACLKKERDERPPTMDSLAAMLDAYVAPRAAYGIPPIDIGDGEGRKPASGKIGAYAIPRATTSRPLTAMFAVAMLGWFAWYESKKRIGQVVFYAFLGLATLAKGPVAIFFAGAILLIFLALKRDWSAILSSLWIPGIATFVVVALPWYVAVQLRNPEFFRVFILEHNLGRFGQDLYHHRQPFWYYLPVLLLALMPWTLWLVLAVVERLRLLWSEKREAMTTLEDSWQIAGGNSRAVVRHTER